MHRLGHCSAVSVHPLIDCTHSATPLPCLLSGPPMPGPPQPAWGEGRAPFAQVLIASASAASSAASFTDQGSRGGARQGVRGAAPHLVARPISAGGATGLSQPGHAAAPGPYTHTAPPAGHRGPPPGYAIPMHAARGGAAVSHSHGPTPTQQAPASAPTSLSVLVPAPHPAPAAAHGTKGATEPGSPSRVQHANAPEAAPPSSGPPPRPDPLHAAAGPVPSQTGRPLSPAPAPASKVPPASNPTPADATASPSPPSIATRVASPLVRDLRGALELSGSATAHAESAAPATAESAATEPTPALAHAESAATGPIPGHTGAQGVATPAEAPSAELALGSAAPTPTPSAATVLAAPKSWAERAKAAERTSAAQVSQAQARCVACVGAAVIVLEPFHVCGRQVHQ